MAGDFAAAQLALRPIHPDIGQVWFAARALLHGQNPYALIGPGRAFEWPAPFFYPLPAAVLALPLGLLSEAHAVFAFVALGVGTMAWALTSDGWSGLWAFSSICVLHAVMIGQWSPLLAGTTAFAPLTALLVAKPTVGAAVFAYRPSAWKWTLGGALALTLVAFLLQPTWVSDWQQALHATSLGAEPGFPYRAPIIRPGGALVLLALTRWRRPEARLLVALACVPHTTLLYEGTLLFLVPRGRWQMLALSALSWAMLPFVITAPTPTNLAGYVNAYAPVMVACLYLPCTLMILRRPNV